MSNLDNGYSDQYNANKEGACEAGFSAALSQDGLTVLMGAPGRYLLNGELYTVLIYLLLYFIEQLLMYLPVMLLFII